MKKSFKDSGGDAKKRIIARCWLLSITLIVFNMLCSVSLFAQDGAAGINEATNKVKGYFDAGCNLMYAIGAILGIVGAIKVLCAMNCLAA